MKRLVLVLSLITVGACAQTPEVAVVRGTFTIEKNPSEGRAAAQFSAKVETALQEASLPFSLLAEEEVERGALEGHRLAIFPYSANWTETETAQLVRFITGGGKAFLFYTVPGPVLDAIGARNTGSRRQDFEGQYAQMRFADDRPAGFPASVKQTSRNLALCEPVGESQVIARWYTSEGEDTGTPAVILSPTGAYMSHVLHEGDAGQQGMLVLAVVGHFLPHLWDMAVQGALDSAFTVAELSSLQALREQAAGHAAAETLAKRVEGTLAEARAALADKRYEVALEAARSASGLAADCVAATYGSRDGELRGVWSGGGARDWEATMAALEEAGFNAIFPNMCSANYTSYPSEVLPQSSERDEMALCLEAAARHGIEVHVWRINWCMLGGDAARREEFLDQGRCMVSVTGKPMVEDPSTGGTVWMCPSHEGNREIEKQAMLELTRKYHPAGIHFDYMRFPSRDYCYCDRCRAKFEAAYGVKVENWPADCFAGGTLFERYKAFRKELQTSLVREIAAESRAIDPEVKISLAARSALPGAPENDGQDWPNWCQEYLLDFVCPMDYTGENDDRLRRWLNAQVPAVEGSVPLYAGLGVTYRHDSLSNPVKASRQVRIARECGADGFLIFSLNTVCETINRGLALGATSIPVTVMPHHYPELRTFAELPAPAEGLPANARAVGERFQARLHLFAPEGIEQLRVRWDLCTTDGEVVQAGGSVSTGEATWTQTVTGGADKPGAYQWVLSGEVAYGQNDVRPFILRTTPWHALTASEADTLRGRSDPPRFKTDGIRVGVLMGGYGSEGILKALSVEEGIEAAALYRPDRAHLAACEVVVAPQRQSETLEQLLGAKRALVEYVRAGGGLLVTHDAVGVRQHPPLFPELCQGSGVVKLTSARVAAEHPLTAGLKVGESFEHSYYDHATVAITGAMTAVVDDEEGNVVVAAGEVAKGRFVASGLCVGLGLGDAEVAPKGAELAVLVNAVRWLAGRERSTTENG